MKNAGIYSLIGFRYDNKEYLVKNNTYKNNLNELLKHLSTFYKNETLENIKTIFSKIIWLSEDDCKRIKDKKYIKSNNEGLTLLFLIERSEPEKVKEHMEDLLDEYKKAILAKYEDLKDHIQFDDKEAYKKVDSHFIRIDDMLHCRFLNYDKTKSYKFKVIINLDKDLIEVTDGNSVKTYDRINCCINI